MRLHGFFIPLLLLCLGLHAPGLTEKEAKALIEQLGADEFKVRKAASDKLKALLLERPETEKLFKAHSDHPDPEIRIRVQEAMVRISRIAKWWPASLEGRIRSPKDENPRLLKLTNAWEKPIRIFWLDYEGKRKPWSVNKVQPGNTLKCHQTYEGHAWLFTNEVGKALGIFTLGPDTQELHFSGPVK